MKNLTNFNEAIKGTFFEELLETPTLPINLPILSGDLEVGHANFFELQCMYFFLKNYYPEKYQDKVLSAEDRLILESRAKTVLGIMRSLISDRLKLDGNIIHRLWIREGDIIVVEKIFLE